MPAVDASRNEADLELLRGAAAEAGAIAMRYFRKDPEVWMKDGSSPVSEADFAADRFLRETLLAARPDYGWLSEETTDNPARLAARRTFVVDPIDGTRAFIDGRSTWCVSVAVVEDGVSRCGVLDCPAKGSVFWSAEGSGAFQDGRRLRITPPGEHPRIAGPNVFLKNVDQPLRERMTSVSYIPSLAYRIAMIANGEIDATFVKPDAHDWDIAAADVILREAGGRIVNHRGEAPRYAGEVIRHGALAAGSGSLLDSLAPIIAEVDT